MSTPALQRAWQAARRRRAAAVLLFWLPLALLPALLSWRLGAGTAAWLVLLASLAALAVVAWQAARRLDQAWLIRRLNQAPDLDDSSDLLFATPAALGPLQTLQRQRLEQRLHARPRDLRPAWPWRWWPWTLLGVLAGVAVLAWPQPSAPAAPTTDPATTARAAAGKPGLRQARLRSTPPAYTGLPPAELPELDGRVPAGTRLQWQLQVQPARARWRCASTTAACSR